MSGNSEQDDESGNTDLFVSPESQRLHEYLSQLDQETKAVITMQYTPDPDSMASALGVQWLLEAQIGRAHV